MLERDEEDDQQQGALIQLSWVSEPLGDLKEQVRDKALWRKTMCLLEMKII